jgi:hypothetical protein
MGASNSIPQQTSSFLAQTSIDADFHRACRTNQLDTIQQLVNSHSHRHYHADIENGQCVSYHIDDMVYLVPKR